MQYVETLHDPLQTVLLMKHPHDYTSQENQQEFYVVVANFTHIQISKLLVYQFVSFFVQLLRHIKDGAECWDACLACFIGNRKRDAETLIFAPFLLR